jgi:hypothetical protein
LFSSAQAGRLSLPACAEEVVRYRRPSERRSLSASQAAEPRVIVTRIKCNLDKLGGDTRAAAVLYYRTQVRNFIDNPS